MRTWYYLLRGDIDLMTKSKFAKVVIFVALYDFMWKPLLRKGALQPLPGIDRCKCLDLTMDLLYVSLFVLYKIIPRSIYPTFWSLSENMHAVLKSQPGTLHMRISLQFLYNRLAQILHPDRTYQLKLCFCNSSNSHDY